MANTYTNDVTISLSTTHQSRIIRCPVTSQLIAGNTITVVTANSVAACLDIAAFNHVSSSAAANTHTGSSAGSTAPSCGGLTSTTAGDIAIGVLIASNSPTVGSLRDGLGNTMTQVGSTQAGQSRTSAAMWFVEAGGVLPNPAATLGTSQAWAMAGSRSNNDGSTITHIASSDASSGWQADPGNKTFTVNIPVGVTIPSGATLFLFLNSTGNTGANTITDNGGVQNLTQGVSAASATSATGSVKLITKVLAP